MLSPLSHWSCQRWPDITPPLSPTSLPRVFNHANGITRCGKSSQRQSPFFNFPSRLRDAGSLPLHHPRTRQTESNSRKREGTTSATPAGRSLSSQVSRSSMADSQLHQVSPSGVFSSQVCGIICPLSRLSVMESHAFCSTMSYYPWEVLMCGLHCVSAN